jgi:hypothetical protein
MRPEIKDLETIVKYCERIEYYLHKYESDEDEFLANADFQEGCAF